MICSYLAATEKHKSVLTRRAEDTAFEASAAFSSPKTLGRNLSVPCSRLEQEQQGQQYIKGTFVTLTIYTVKAFKSMLRVKRKYCTSEAGAEKQTYQA